VKATGTRFRAEHFRRRLDAVEGWTIRVTSYALPGRFIAEVDNLSPGATVGRAAAPTREEAERLAIEKARSRLAATRRLPVD
jgi:hypothetical protein